MIDTNSNPKFVDFPIPANDDATKSISIILDAICDAIRVGLEDRKNTKEKGTDKADVAETIEEVAVVAAPKAVVEVTPEAVVEATPEDIIEATPEAIIEATPEVVVEVTPEAIVEATPEVTEVIEETKEETKED